MSKGERGRAGRESGSDMRKLYIVLAAAAMIGVGAVGISVASGSGGAVTAPVTVEGLDDLERLVELAQGVTKGDEGAPITTRGAPERARRMGWEGKVILSFMIHEDGSVHDARILQSSGVTVLDEAAKEALRKSVIHSQIATSAKRVHVVLPIEYRLR